MPAGGHVAQAETKSALVTADDLRALAPLIGRIIEHEREVLEGWSREFDQLLGAEPTIAAEDMTRLAGAELAALADSVACGRLEPYANSTAELGKELLQHGVPFARAVGAACLLWDAVLEVVARDVDTAELIALEKLSHYRLLCLANEYFRCGTVMVPRVASAGLAGGEGSGQSGSEAQASGLVGSSEAMSELHRAISAAAQARGTVFIVGESGTGKELTARAVHRQSRRANRPLVVVNCAALPAGLFESELFGHTEGAYTGAERSYSGLIRAAAGGMLFLDEITEMPVSVQAKLLRVLEEGTVRPVGATQEIPSQVRFIASTNRDPEQAVRAGVLRADVYHRINVHRIDTPPLRDHLEDIPALVAHFSRELAGQGYRVISRFHADALAILQQYTWPGNVRELRNAVEVAMTAGSTSVIKPGLLPGYILSARSIRDAVPRVSVPTFAAAERALIARALAATSGNKRRAAQLLGISRHRLYDKLRKYQLDQSD